MTKFRLLQHWRDYPVGTLFTFTAGLLRNQPHLYELYDHRYEPEWFEVLV